MDAPRGPAVQDPKFGWREIPEALRLLDDGGVSAISSYVFIDGVSALVCCISIYTSPLEALG